LPHPSQFVPWSLGPDPEESRTGVPKATGAAGRARDPESGEKSEVQLFCFFVLSYGGRR
jgi:hypothetical protein